MNVVPWVSLLKTPSKEIFIKEELSSKDQEELVNPQALFVKKIQEPTIQSCVSVLMIVLGFGGSLSSQDWMVIKSWGLDWIFQIDLK